MGKGLFFTGVVLKNNRNLLQEKAAREALELQKEQLELNREAAVARRQEARRKNLSVDTKDYDPSSMDPALAKDFQVGVKSYEDQANQDAILINEGNLDARSRLTDTQGGLQTQMVLYNDITKHLNAHRTLVQQGKGDTLKTTDDGRYLFEVQYENYLKAISEDPSASRFELEKQFSIRSGMINETKFIDPNSAFFKNEASNREGSETYINEETGVTTTVSFLKDSQFDRAGLDILKGLTPNANGTWDNPDQKKVYIGQEGVFKVEGLDQVLSGPEAFAYERYGITSIKDEATGETPFLDKLMPNSGPENEEIRREYVEYLRDKYIQQAKEDNPGISTRKQTVGGKSSLTDSDILLIESKVETKDFNGVNLKVGSTYEPAIKEQKGIPVPISAFSEVEGQDVTQISKDIAILAEGSNSITTTLTGFGLDESNNPVALMTYGPNNTQALIPISYIAGMTDVLKPLKDNPDVMRLINYSIAKQNAKDKPKETLNWK